MKIWVKNMFTHFNDSFEVNIIKIKNLFTTEVRTKGSRISGVLHCVWYNKFEIRTPCYRD